MTSAQPRMTIATKLVLHALLLDPSQELYGLEICQAAGLPSGTIHPILSRLERIRWLESRWEKVDPQIEGRPRRRYYKLTALGVELARGALASSNSSIGGLPRPLPALVEDDA
ncbi:helix-turn-helix transcriptional regulator [Actinoplanes sp. NPDC049596]|uniref:PadR family transcriptional regulator n=1 Tax=unclassified Actinoplanes TaxID=2626549 RepID=UPI00342CDA67